MPERRSLAEIFSDFDSIKTLPTNDVLPAKQLASIVFSQHPLGFAWAIVNREGPFALRIHVWPSFARFEQQPNWPIHNHRFDLKSRVLTGELENRLYRVSREIEPLGHRLYDVTYEADKSVMSPTEARVSLELFASQRITAPQSYSIEAGTFHETFVQPNVFCATLAITNDSVRNLDIKTVGDLELGTKYEYSRSALPQAINDSIIFMLQPLLQ